MRSVTRKFCLLLLAVMVCSSVLAAPCMACPMGMSAQSGCHAPRPEEAGQDRLSRPCCCSTNEFTASAKTPAEPQERIELKRQIAKTLPHFIDSAQKIAVAAVNALSVSSIPEVAPFSRPKYALFLVKGSFLI